MEEMDNVIVIVEKEKYAQEGVHKGMYGWICNPKCVGGYWLVNFPQCGEKNDIATTSIREEDLEVVSVLYAKRNEEIKEQFEQAGEKHKATTGQTVIREPEDISDYLI